MDIVKHNHPALSTVSTPINPQFEHDRAEVLKWHREAYHLLLSEKTGVGLAANQTNNLKRMILIWPDRHRGQELPILMVNPEVFPRTRDHAEDEEGCLSYPGVRTPIRRFKNIEVQYLDQDLQPKMMNFSGWAARVVQHECDHLDGICRVGDAWRKREARKERP